MKIYKVGGAVRDSLMGVKSSDNDWVVVGSSPEEMVSNGFNTVNVTTVNYSDIYNDIRHEMDIYVPKTDQKSHPVVMTIYGSAWRKNDQKASNYIKKILIQPLLKSGIAVVSINHRTSLDAKFPAQIHDVKASLRFGLILTLILSPFS